MVSPSECHQHELDFQTPLGPALMITKALGPGALRSPIL